MGFVYVFFLHFAFWAPAHGIKIIPKQIFLLPLARPHSLLVQLLPTMPARRVAPVSGERQHEQCWRPHEQLARIRSPFLLGKRQHRARLLLVLALAHAPCKPVTRDHRQLSFGSDVGEEASRDVLGGAEAWALGCLGPRLNRVDVAKSVEQGQEKSGEKSQLELDK